MSQKRSGYVWFISATALIVYATLGLLGFAIPGVQDLVTWLSRAQGWEFYVAGFLAIMLEGLYVLGNFFPGTTMVLLLAVLSGVGGTMQFIFTIAAIFLGWCVAGLLNISVAYYWLRHQTVTTPATPVRDNLLLTWFPAFRANYEVAQIVAGGSLRGVLLSALRVRFFASLAAGAGAVILMTIVDITTIDNEEGFISVLAVATIMIVVGSYQLRKAKHFEPNYARTD